MSKMSGYRSVSITDLNCMILDIFQINILLNSYASMIHCSGTISIYMLYSVYIKQTSCMIYNYFLTYFYDNTFTSKMQKKTMLLTFHFAYIFGRRRISEDFLYFVCNSVPIFIYGSS